MNNSKKGQTTIKEINIQYSDGSGVRVKPYRLTKDDHGYEIAKPQQHTDFGLEYYDKKGRVTEYEGSWKQEQLLSWLHEIIESENVDLDAEFKAFVSGS